MHTAHLMAAEWVIGIEGMDVIFVYYLPATVAQHYLETMTQMLRAFILIILAHLASIIMPPQAFRAPASPAMRQPQGAEDRQSRDTGSGESSKSYRARVYY